MYLSTVLDADARRSTANNFALSRWPPPSKDPGVRLWHLTRTTSTPSPRHLHPLLPSPLRLRQLAVHARRRARAPGQGSPVLQELRRGIADGSWV